MSQHFTCICSTDETTGKVYRRVEKSGAFHDEYTYSYDSAGHLKEVFRNDMLRESYTYNGKGQRTLRLNGWDDGAVRYKYDDNGCLLAMICNNSRLFDYDENGNLIRSRELVFREPDKETKYFYQDTLLKGVLLPDGTELVYVYDEGGKNSVCPVAKYKNGKPVMRFVWKDIRFLESCVDVERGIRFDFTYKNGKLASVRLSRAGMEKMTLGDFGNGSDILSRFGGGGLLLAFCDQVGTPKLFTNKAGRHIKEMSYDSFGILDDDSLPELFIPIGFAGGLLDEDTGLVRFGFRDYYPAIGRFTCPDPIGDTGGDHDLYDYCVDDPVSNFDPLGLFGMGGFTKQQGVREKATRGLHEGKSKEPSLMKQESPIPDYIEIKKRPLDWPLNLGERIYKWPGDLHHRHAIGNNGYNKGFGPEGFGPDNPANFQKYSPYDGVKYNGPLMKEALERVEAEKISESAIKKLDVGDMFDRLSHIPGFDDNIDRQQAEDMAGGIYFANKYDCRDYMNEAVKRTKKLGDERGISPFYKKE